MRIAETTGSRAMIAICALSVFALIAATWETAAPARTHEPRPVRPMRGCNQGRARVAPPPVVAAEVQRNGHADTLIGARDVLSACMRDQTVPVRVSLDISADGRVTSVEVRAMADDLAQLDMHVVKCLNAAVSPLVFPRGDAAVRISTHLTAR
jgi:outer membrane biosynthesis protein TonB